MAAVDDKLTAIGFNVQTRLDADGIRRAGLVAIEAGRRFMNSTIKERGVNPTSIAYEIDGPGGLVTQLAFNVRWKDAVDGLRAVTVSHTEYLTSTSTFLMIPVSPKRAPGLKSYQRFAEAFRDELTAN